MRKIWLLALTICLFFSTTLNLSGCTDKNEKPNNNLQENEPSGGNSNLEATENYLKIELALEYYHASEGRTVTYTIDGNKEYTIKKDELITSLNIQTPTVSKKDKEDYIFSYWAYKDQQGEYKNIKDVIASEEIAIDGVITLYPVSSYDWFGPH